MSSDCHISEDIDIRILADDPAPAPDEVPPPPVSPDPPPPAE